MGKKWEVYQRNRIFFKKANKNFGADEYYKWKEKCNKHHHQKDQAEEESVR